MKENSTKPKVTLSFELSRSGIITLNKADAKIEETYVVEEKVTKKVNKTSNDTTDALSDDATSDANATANET
jgi:hypothetical protein